MRIRKNEAARFGRRSTRILCLVVAVTVPAAAHNPHDQVDTLALSSSYSVDEIVFIAQQGASNVRIQEPLMSTNGGLTWSGVPEGMDNLSDFSSVSVSPRFSQDGVVFYTTDSDGVFVSQNAGATWARVNAGLPTTEIATSAIAIDANGDVVLFVTGREEGLYRTSDLGASWTTSIGTGTRIVAVAVSPDFESDSTLFVAGEVGDVASSADGGSTWTLHGPVDPTAPVVREIAVAPDYAQFGETFFASSGGLFRSTDFAATFELVSDANGALVAAVAASPDYRTDSTLFSLTADKAVFKSTDGGDSWVWHDIGAELVSQTQLHFRRVVISDGFATDGTVFVAAFEGLYKSVDGGETWIELETRPPTLITGVAVSPGFANDGALMVSTYGGGAYVSGDGGSTWGVASLGLGSSTLYDVDFAPDRVQPPVAFVNYRGFVAKTANPAAAWERLQIAESPNASIFPEELEISPDHDAGGVILTGTRATGLLGSVDDGQSWLQAALPQNMSVVVISPQFDADRTIFASSRSGEVFRSTNGGSVWDTLGGGLPATRHVVRLALSPSFAVDQVVVAGTAEGLYGSEDAGDSWTVMGAGSAVGSGIIEQIKISPDFDNDGTLLASVRGAGAFRSQDAGETWELVGQDLFAEGHQLLEFDFSPTFATDGIIFGSALTSLLRSTDGGQSWLPTNVDLVRYEETRQGRDAQSVDFTPGWVDVEAVEASTLGYRASSTQSAGVLFRFFGTGVRWIGFEGPTLGIAEVRVDGAVAVAVDQYAEQVNSRVSLFTRVGLPLGLHEIEVVVTGDKNPESSGFETRVDAFDVLRF